MVGCFLSKSVATLYPPPQHDRVSGPLVHCESATRDVELAADDEEDEACEELAALDEVVDACAEVDVVVFLVLLEVVFFVLLEVDLCVLVLVARRAARSRSTMAPSALTGRGPAAYAEDATAKRQAPAI